MQHTSVRISDKHADLIKETGKSTSEVVREALDMYFHSRPEDDIIDKLRGLIIDHERWCHGDAHNLGTHGKRITAEPKNVPQKCAQRARIVPQGDVPQECAQFAQVVPKNVRRIILAIKDFHDRGTEPLVAEIAEKVGMETRPMGKLLGKYGIKAQKTHRGGVQGRYFTFDLSPLIEGLPEEG
jgi:hypothetical protein